ncbi:amidohydrolase [Youhaiella tibetensis]|uniref:Amidohydrolase n=1 Tax=Paradevosia tibetensis TaxID=1447062 RepID=A0A5B9DM95_9HYPH|nr:amidohydrolase [Youhaiella tibetensis]QEE20015.1 amidohydrolase [Youhaiella tibetensis]GGF27854.1 amidohydrolase [Youhaiella tibetensis]
MTTADLILTNGRIYTVDRALPWVEAVAIANGRITALGSDADVRAAAPGASVIDLEGRMAMPGIVDVHNHVLMGGTSDLFELRFAGDASVEEICALVRAAAQKAPAGQWIMGAQWGADAIAALNTLQALAQLDEAALGHPVCLRDETAHNRWVNSEAMRLAGITEATPDPEMGSFGRDPATGKLTGMMIESAAGIVERVAAEQFTEGMGRAAAAQAIRTLNSFGVTAFLEAAAMQSTLSALHGLDQRGELSAWAVAAMPAMEPNFMFGISGDELFALREDYRSEHVRPDYVKIFLDGVPGAKTAAFHEAYVEDPIHGCCFRGATMVTYPELIRWLGKCEAQNLSVKIHCAGDAAVTQALDAVDVVRSFNGPTALIHHIAHASYIAPSDIPRFAELGVAADLSPMIWFPTTFLEGHKEAMGTERAERFWPNADLLKAGALIAGGSDWPVIANPDPWTGIEGLVTRQNPSGAFPGVSLWAEQALDLPTAVEVFTINSAKAIGLDKEIGSLAVGKSADIIVLSQNIFDTPADAIADTKVLKTYFEGREVFSR